MTVMNQRILTAFGALLLATASYAAPQIKWLETEHDFGAFDEDMGNVSADFHLVNTGDEPLVILAARASCGCTVPSYTSKPVEPGDTAVVKVIYNPTGRPGKFDKRVKVETNTTPRQSVLLIKGTVIGASNTLRARFPIDAGPLKLRRDAVPFGEILKGRTNTAFLEVYNQSADTIRPVISGLPSYISVVTEPADVPPGQQGTFTMFYTAGPDSDWGLTTHDVTVHANGESSPGHDVSLVAIINEDFSKLTAKQKETAPQIALSTTQADLGRIRHGETYEAKVTVENYGKDPLIIRKLSSVDKAISVKSSTMTVKGGKSAVITIKVNTAEAPDDMINSRVTLITNDPSRPTANIRVTGEYIK